MRLAALACLLLLAFLAPNIATIARQTNQRATMSSSAPRNCRSLGRQWSSLNFDLQRLEAHHSINRMLAHSCNSIAASRHTPLGWGRSCSLPTDDLRFIPTNRYYRQYSCKPIEFYTIAPVLSTTRWPRQSSPLHAAFNKVTLVPINTPNVIPAFQ